MCDNIAPTVLTEQAEALVRQKLRGRVLNIRLAVEDGCLVLHGRANSYYAKQLAQHVAMEVIRLPIRANQIDVRG